MTDKLYRVQAGYAGEVKVDKYLESTDFPEPVIVLADVQIPITPNLSIQIDTLILSKSYIVLLEIKNISGTLTYISNPPHFERTHEDRKTIVIDCPIMQLNNNRTGLDIWLEKNGFSVTTTGMIVMANSDTSVKNAPPDMPIIYAKHLPYHFRMKEKGKSILTTNQLHTLAKKLRQDEKLYNPYPLCERNGINPEHLKKGLLCKNCNTILHRKNHLTWTCPGCHQNCKQPAIDAIQDWFMLVKSTISNEECRDFLQMKNKYAANYILKKLPLKREGQSKATQYAWNYQESPLTLANQNKRIHT